MCLCSVLCANIQFDLLCCAQLIFNGRTTDIVRLRATNADTYARWRYCCWSINGGDVMPVLFCSALVVGFGWRWGLGSMLLMSSSLDDGASWDEDDATTSDDEGEWRRTKQRKKDIKIYCRNIFSNNFSLFYKKFRFYVVVVCWFHFNDIFLFVIFLFTFILRENENKYKKRRPSSCFHSSLCTCCTWISFSQMLCWAVDERNTFSFHYFFTSMILSILHHPIRPHHSQRLETSFNLKIF